MTAAITPKAGVIGGRNAREARGTRGNGPSATSDFATHRREIGTFVVTIPFFAYTACFLLAPTVIVIVGAFQNLDGGFTLNNFSKLFEANTIAAFATSILVSVISALIGAVVGAVASYALVIGSKPNGLLLSLIHISEPTRH